MIKDFLSHEISIPIGSSNKFTKKFVKMLCQNCQIDQCATTIRDCGNASVFRTLSYKMIPRGRQPEW